MKRSTVSRAVLARLAFVFLGLSLLAGCASTLSARVTTFSQWPANVEGQQYRIELDANQANNLESQAYADMVRASAGRTGLSEARSDQKPRFVISFAYQNPVTQTVVQQYADPFFYGGPFIAPWGGFYGPHYGWGAGILYSPPVVNVPVTTYKNTFTLVIRDNSRSGAEVYRSTAVILSDEDELPQLMPYLVRSIFDGFPENNGSTRDITYELGR